MADISFCHLTNISFGAFLPKEVRDERDHLHKMVMEELQNKPVPAFMLYFTLIVIQIALYANEAVHLILKHFNVL